MTKEQEDLIFHLYIVEDGDFTDSSLELWKQNPKCKERLTGLTNDEIRQSAIATAVKMNELIGHQIY